MEMKSGESTLSGRVANALVKAERPFDGRTAEKARHQHFGNDLAGAGAASRFAVNTEESTGFIRAGRRIRIIVIKVTAAKII